MGIQITNQLVNNHEQNICWHRIEVHCLMKKVSIAVMEYVNMRDVVHTEILNKTKKQKR